MSQKTISLNPDFLMPGTIGKKGGNKSRKKREKKQKPQTLVKPNKLRKQLLSRIKDFQKKNEEYPKIIDVKTDIKEFDNDFNESLKYLESLAKNKREKRIKKNIQIPPLVSNDIPISLEQVPSHTTYTTATIETDISHPSTHQTLRLKQRNVPPYSNLKNGTRPTYREWKKKQTSSLTIVDKPEENTPSARSLKLEEIKQSHQNIKPNIISQPISQPIPDTTPKIQKRVKTTKYHLGKTPEQIAVLIKSRKTRKLVQHEHALLKQKGILEVKNYLRSKNLIKAGSNAPNDVLRQMYEQAILAGEISNKSKENLLHNFFNNDK